MLVETDKIRKYIEEKKAVEGNNFDKFLITGTVEKIMFACKKEGAENLFNSKENINIISENIRAYKDENKPEAHIAKQYAKYLNDLAGYEMILSKLNAIEEIAKKIDKEETINPLEYFKLL